MMALDSINTCVLLAVAVLALRRYGLPGRAKSPYESQVKAGQRKGS